MIVDLHSHLVPGVDDGASSVEDALLALEGLGAEGVAALITTPHLLLPQLESVAAVDRELDRQRRSFDRLVAARAAAARPLPTISLGQEIWAPDAASLRRALSARALGMGESDYLLVEFGFDLRGDHLEVVRTALDGGWRIVIAHPERYRPAGETDVLELAASWHEAGALLQVNAGSLGGHYLRSSPASLALAWELVERGLAGLVATDHHASNRPVSVREAWNLLVDRRGEGLARKLMIEMPQRISIAGQSSLASTT